MRKLGHFLSGMVLLAAPLAAQTITASLEGIATDATGAAVPGAAVSVINTATGATYDAETGPSGRFLITSLQPGGPYSVSMEAEGFKRVERTGIMLVVEQAARIGFSLEVGAVSETIEVTGQVPLLETTTSSMGQLVDNTSVSNLPLNSRNPFSLALLVPGVIGWVGDNFNNARIAVNGGRPGTNEILVDGVPSSPPLVNPIQGFTVLPSVDSVQEFKVQTNNFSAEFGRSGGGVINMIYKSGTNEFHGSLFEFLRNSKMDSNNFFANRSGVPLGSYKRNQFGATVMGPISIPKLYNGKNRSFFLFAYEGLRERSAANQQTTVPTALQRAGDFSQTFNGGGQLVQIFDPTTTVQSGSVRSREAFVGNLIPASRVNPVSRNLMGFYPQPNRQGDGAAGTNNWVSAGSAQVDINKWESKWDQVINDGNRFFLRVSRRKMLRNPTLFLPDEIAVANGGAFQPQDSIGAAFDYTWTVSPTLLLNVRGGLSRMLLSWRPHSFGFDPVSLGMPNYIREEADGIEFPGFRPTGYRTLGGGNPDFRRNAFETHPYSAHLTKILTNHSLKVGMELRALRVHNSEFGQMVGRYIFGRAPTQGPDPTRASNAAGDGLASMLIGLGTSGTFTKNFKSVSTQSLYVAGYVADDWKVSNKLTLNLGLRWDLDTPRVERYNRSSYFNPDAAHPLAGPSGISDLRGGLEFVGIEGRSRRWVPADYNNFAPRVGFAYQAIQKLVVRSGYGLFYTPGYTGASGGGDTGWRSDTPYVGMIGVEPNDYIDDPFPDGFIPQLGSALGLLTNVGANPGAVWLDTKIPHMHQWNFNIQYQLPGNFSVEAAYTGSRSLHIDNGTINMNQLTREQLKLGSALLDRVDNPFFGLIDVGVLSNATVPRRYLLQTFPQFTAVSRQRACCGSSTYHSFQFKLQKRFSNGLSVLTSYTKAKLLDTWTGSFQVGAGSALQNIYDMPGEWSLGGNDIAQRFVTSYVYELPFGRNRRFGGKWNRTVDAIAGGWQVNGIITISGGYPLRLTTSNTSQSFSRVLRPNNNGTSAELSGPVNERLEEFFDTSVFSQPEPYSFGDTGRYLPDVRAPGVATWDFSLFKNFTLTEKTRLQVRAEFFNFTNTPNFRAPNTSFNSNQFGRITSQANIPRQTQLGLKLLF